MIHGSIHFLVEALRNGDSHVLENKGVLVPDFFEDFGDGLASSVTGGGFDADEHGVVVRLGWLGGGRRI